MLPIAPNAKIESRFFQSARLPPTFDRSCGACAPAPEGPSVANLKRRIAPAAPVMPQRTAARAKSPHRQCGEKVRDRVPGYWFSGTGNGRPGITACWSMQEILPKTVVPLTSPADAGELSRRSMSKFAVHNTVPFKYGLDGNSRM